MNFDGLLLHELRIPFVLNYKFSRNFGCILVGVIKTCLLLWRNTIAYILNYISGQIRFVPSSAAMLRTVWQLRWSSSSIVYSPFPRRQLRSCGTTPSKRYTSLPPFDSPSTQPSPFLRNALPSLYVRYIWMHPQTFCSWIYDHFPVNSTPVFVCARLWRTLRDCRFSYKLSQHCLLSFKTSMTSHRFVTTVSRCSPRLSRCLQRLASLEGSRSL